MVSYGIYQLFNLIMLLMLIRVLLTWFPNINWFNEPFHSLRKFTDIFFEPFRRIIPPIGMIDVSPIVAFFVLGLVQRLLCSLLQGLGF